MTKVSLTSLVVACAALAACSDKDVNNVTAPDLQSSRNEVSAEMRGASTVDGPADIAFARGGVSSQLSKSVRAATGGHASGPVMLTLGTGFFTNIATEEYNFVSLTTGNSPTPFAAKGQYRMKLVTTTGVVQEFEGEIVCMGITGNQARMAGQLTSVVINGIPRAINPAASHNIWNVTDNGEGKGAIDTASPMIFFPATAAPLHCANDFIPPQFANETGNLQVR